MAARKYWWPEHSGQDFGHCAFATQDSFGIQPSHHFCLIAQSKQLHDCSQSPQEYGCRYNDFNESQAGPGVAVRFRELPAAGVTLHHSDS